MAQQPREGVSSARKSATPLFVRRQKRREVETNEAVAENGTAMIWKMDMEENI